MGKLNFQMFASSLAKRAFASSGKCLTGEKSRFTTILGAQWGDEGKGKLVDILAKDHDLCARFNGGANAGHTIVVDELKQLDDNGINYTGRLKISTRAHLVSKIQM